MAGFLFLTSRLHLAAFAALLALPCRADPDSPHSLDLSLEELGSIKIDTVYAASKFTEKVTDAPGSVTIVTRDEIKKFGYRTLAEVLRGVRSFDVMHDRNYGYTGVRGLNELDDYGSHTLLLIDGHRMNDPLYETAAVDTDAFLDLDLIDHIEVIRGAGSAIYGSNAFLGVINVVTRRGGSLNTGEAATSIGSFDAFQGRFSYGKKFSSGLELMLSGTTYMSEGNSKLFYPEFRDTNGGIVRNRDSDRFWSVFGSMSYGDLTLEGGHVSRDKSVPTASYGSIFNSLNDTVDSKGFIDLRYNHKTENDWGIEGRVFYDWYDFHEHFLFDYGDGIPVFNDNPARARWWGAEVSTSHTFLDRYRFTYGLDFRRTLTVHQSDYDTNPFTSYADVSSSETVIGTYLDSQIELTKKLHLNAGVRYDHYDTFGNTINPRGGLIWKPWEKTSVKLLYGTAFRAPNAYQRDFSGVGFLANPNLKPETIDTYELLAEHYFNKHWRATASLFDNRIHDLIRSTIDPTTGNSVFTNARDVDARGVEAEIEGKWDNGLLLRLSYTHAQTRDLQTNDRVEYSPENFLKSQVSVPLWRDKLFGSVELIYATDRLTLAHAHTGDMWLVNATLFAKELAPHLECSASIYNLLGQKYSYPGGTEHLMDMIEQDGRTFRLKLTYQF